MKGDLAKVPQVWLVVGDKLGDNAQVEIIAEALSWPVERKTLRFQTQWVTGKPPFKAIALPRRPGSAPMRWSRPGRTWC